VSLHESAKQSSLNEEQHCLPNTSKFLKKCKNTWLAVYVEGLHIFRTCLWLVYLYSLEQVHISCPGVVAFHVSSTTDTF
jgi:hypothetical protein